jgi:cell division protease FtsH
VKPNMKAILLWVALIGLAIFLFTKVSQDSGKPAELAYTEFITKIEEKSVASVTIHSKLIEGEYIENKGRFQTTIQEGLINDTVLQKLKDKGVKVTIAEDDQGGFSFSFLLNIVLLTILIVLFFLMMRQLQSGGGKAMSFGKSKAKLLSENHNRVTFEDVAGIDEAKEELQEIIDFLKDPKKFTKLGGRIPKGVLLMGSPGTGKTLLAKAIAGEAGVPFFSISGSDFVEMFVGVGASRVRDLFEQGKKNAPCIVFIDEIDAVGRHRGAGLGGGHDEREQTLNQLLVEMDGFESNDGVILIAATNRPDVLDPALQRPGRFDRRIIVPRPDVKGREQILKVHIKRAPLADDVDIPTLAKVTPGFSGADLENLVNEAALIAARSNKDKVANIDFEKARDKVMMGPERRSMFMTEEEKKHTAYHEAGHTLVAMLIPGSTPIHKVTIIPRGMALGVTQSVPERDVLDISRDQAAKKIAMMMGGRAADELIIGEPTAGASNDIEKATELARRMVCDWGMSAKLGPLAFGQKEGEVFLGREFSQKSNYSEQTAILIDAEIKDIVTTEYHRAKSLLQENIDKLHKVAEALLEYETLDGGEVAMIIKGETLSRPKHAEPKQPQDQAKKPRGLFSGLVPDPSKA